MPHVTTKTLHTYYERAGSGPPLLVISGTGSDLRKKPNIMDSPLSSHFDLISYDQRGLGQSEKPDHGYTMAAYADDAAALLDALKLDTVMVLGISFGGMVAQEMALRHAKKISHMALFCTSPGGAGGASYPLHELAELAFDDMVKRQTALNDTRLAADWYAEQPELFETARQRLDMSAYASEPGFQHGRLGQLAARRQHDCWDRLPEIACPVWLAGGRYDGIALPQSMQNMADRLPNATLSFFDGGHLFMLQDAGVFPALIKFLNQETP